MKKFAILLSSLFMVFAMSACGESNPPPQPEVTNTEVVVPPAEHKTTVVAPEHKTTVVAPENKESEAPAPAAPANE